MQVLDDEERYQSKGEVRDRIQRARRVRESNHRIITDTRSVVLARDIVLSNPPCRYWGAHEHTDEEVCKAEDASAQHHDSKDPYMPTIDCYAMEEDSDG